MTTAFDIAHYIVVYYSSITKYSGGNDLVNTKLQKLLFFVQEEALVRTGMPIFQEKIYAWNYGPVVPEVYEKYDKQYRGRIIQLKFVGDEYKVNILDEKERYMINKVIVEKGKFSSGELNRQFDNEWCYAYTKADHNIQLREDKDNNAHLITPWDILKYANYRTDSDIQHLIDIKNSIDALQKNKRPLSLD